MNEQTFVKGLTTFEPHEKAPDFVLQTLIIDIDELRAFLETQADNMTEYKGRKQLRCQVLKSKSNPKRFTITVDTYKKEETNEPPF